MEIDPKYMKRALSLARHGLFYTHPNPMVGAVIVDPQGNILGEGYHRRCGEAHAEVNAINSVADKALLRDSTLYVTLEPCSHHGRTAPCADLIIKMGIPRVVVGVRDPFPEVNGRGIERLREAGVEVVVGVLEQQCRKLNASFFIAHEKKRPYIMLKWAQSTDGYLDIMRDATMPPPSISNALTRTLVHRSRAYFDAILVGSGTILADDPMLDNRYWPGPSPRPIILDRRKRIKGDYKVMKRDPIIITDDLPLEENLKNLYKQGITSIVVEGGAEVLSSFIKNALWDCIRVEIGPVNFGEYGICHAPRLHGYEPTLVRIIEGQTIKYYASTPLIIGANI